MATISQLEDKLAVYHYPSNGNMNKDALLEAVEYVERWTRPSGEVKLETKKILGVEKEFTSHGSHYLSLREPGKAHEMGARNYPSHFSGGAFRKHVSERPTRILKAAEYLRMAPIFRSYPCNYNELAEVHNSWRDELAPFFDDANKFRTKLREAVKLLPLARIHLVAPRWVRRAVQNPSPSLLNKHPWTSVPVSGALVYEGPAWRVWVSLARSKVTSPVLVDLEGNFIGSGYCQLEGGFTNKINEHHHELVHGQTMKQPLLQWLQGGFALREGNSSGMFRFQTIFDVKTPDILGRLFRVDWPTKKFPVYVRTAAHMFRIEGPSPTPDHWYYSRYAAIRTNRPLYFGPWQEPVKPATGKPFPEYALGKNVVYTEEMELFDLLAREVLK